MAGRGEIFGGEAGAAGFEAGGEQVAVLGERGEAGGDFAFFVGEDVGEVEQADRGGVGVDLEEVLGWGLRLGGWCCFEAFGAELIDKGEDAGGEREAEVDGVGAGVLAGEELVGGAVGLAGAGGVCDDYRSIEADPERFVVGDGVEDGGVGGLEGKAGQVEAFAVPVEAGEAGGFAHPAEIDSKEAHWLIGCGL